MENDGESSTRRVSRAKAQYAGAREGEETVPMSVEGQVPISRGSAGALPRGRRDSGECGNCVEILLYL